MVNNKQIINIIFRKKPVEMLLNLYKKDNNITYASNLAKEIDCTYSHVVKILQKFEENKLVIFKKNGRIKEIRLTKKGVKISHYIENTINFI